MFLKTKDACFTIYSTEMEMEMNGKAIVSAFEKAFGISIHSFCILTPHGKLLKPTDRQLLLKFKINYTLWELSGYFSMSCRLTKTLRIQAESIVWLSHCRQFTNILIRVYFVIFHLLEIVKLFRNVMLLDCFYCLKTYSFL